MNIYLIVILTFHISNWNHASSNDVEHEKVTPLMDNQVQKHDPWEIDIFERNIKLKVYGRIEEDTFDDFLTLRNLSLVNSILTNVGVNALNKLERLESLSFIHSEGNVHITEESLTKVTNLKELVIHLNNRVIIESKALKNFKNLEILSVDNQTFNAFSNETFDQCRKLKYLSWSNGFVGKIESNTFRSLKKLETVILRDLQLKHIEPSTFEDLPFLRILNLDENKIEFCPGKSSNYFQVCKV
ncbi:hypothetical protein WA026_003755 [Henosepilachna vigintioctopunctata]|uniref:LRR 8 domain containing protein n=1 Tax=Henosepilachna vigintioctopunctata TaxID=420089 RepID=A0AAW1U8I0_9CUCU